MVWESGILQWLARNGALLENDLTVILPLFCQGIVYEQSNGRSRLAWRLVARVEAAETNLREERVTV
jgi:hypothetical protein